MARIRIYKKSILANIVNIFGYACMCAGIALVVEGEMLGGIFGTLFGVLLQFVASNINDNKAFRQWWKTIKAEEQRIVNSVSFAVEVYNMNPCSRTLNEIKKLNEDAAEHIKANLANGQKQRENNTAAYVLIGIFIIAITGLAIFGFNQNKIADSNREMLYGTWLMEVSESEDVRIAVLERLDFDEVEISLVKHIPMTSVANLIFAEDQFYLGLSESKTKVNLERYFSEVFDTLYQHREKIGELYGVDMLALSQEGFQSLYAQMYGKEKYSEMIDDFSRVFSDASQEEYGTYEIKADELVLDGQKDKGSVGYKIGDGKLVLIYENGTEEYVREIQ